MKTLEDVFVSEFRKATSNVGYKNIYNIPLPAECVSWNVSGVDLFVVKGIREEEEPYSKLNNTIVKRLPAGTIAKRRIIDKAIRDFKRDANDEYVYEEVTVPQGSIVVVSSSNLGILYKGYKEVSKSGYGYVDFSDTKYGREYMYIVPKSRLYGLNQTALALSVTNMQNYSGSGYNTWNNGVIYLHVIPYNPRSKYTGSKILATRCSLDYSYEVGKILEFWQQNGIIPNLSLCVLNNGENIALKKTTVGYQEYVQVQSLALGDKEIYGSGDNEDGETGESG